MNIYKKITRLIKESQDITYLIEDYDNIDVVTSEQLGHDSQYHTLLKNVTDAKEYNYHSDYWGSAHEYQEEMVDLLSHIEKYIGDEVSIDFEDGPIKFILQGVLIDDQYNSMSHAKLLVKEIGTQKESQDIKESSTDNVSIDDLKRLKDYLTALIDIADNRGWTSVHAMYTMPYCECISIPGKGYIELTEDIEDEIEDVLQQYNPNPEPYDNV